MARVLFDGSWFEPLSEGALYESEFEAQVLHYCRQIYTDYFLVPFKVLVSDDFSTAKADLAFVRKDYSNWWVVEVEMGHHSLRGHVIPQIETLARGDYGKTHAEYLATQLPDAIDRASALALMKGKSPGVLVIVNEPRQDWIEPLRQRDTLLSVFEVFRSSENQYLVRVNGDQIDSATEELSICYMDSILPRFLIVESPAALVQFRGQKIEIEITGTLTDWQIVETDQSFWLQALRNCNLKKNKKYLLTKRKDGRLRIQTA